MAEKMSVTIVGPGALGSALAVALDEAQVPIAEIVYHTAESGRRAKRLAKQVGARAVQFGRKWPARTRSFAPPGRAPVPTSPTIAKVIWLCVGDSVLRNVAAEMARNGSFTGKIVLHSSGALSADELAPLRSVGASVASAHPMMTFVRSSVPSMKKIAFALEGDKAAVAMARRLVKALGGESFAIGKEDKPLYHALGAFVSPLIVAQMAAVERIGRELKFTAKQTRKIVAPILQQTIRNYIEHGAAAAFSGPLVRGDAETIGRNLAALKRVRGAQEIYRALAKVAAEELPSKDKAAVKKILESIR